MEQLFNIDSYLKEHKTKIKDILIEEDINYLQLEESIFYPQGGGQKGDCGEIVIDDKIYHISKTIKNFNDELATPYLIVEEDINKDLIGKEVLTKINWDFRYQQMRLHSALHLYNMLLDRVIEGKLNLPLVSTIEKEQFAFNKYQNDFINEEVIKQTNELFFKEIEKDQVIKTSADLEKKGYRWWHYGDYQIGCGGTHIARTSEIGNVKVDYSHKKGKKTIKISLI